MQLPANEIEAIESDLEEAATHIYVGGSKYHHYNEDKKNNVPTTQFITADSSPPPYEFPDHYKLYVLVAKGDGGWWNHGQTSGAAVSSSTNEVIYWADSW